MLSTSRVDAFSDGVFAIAVTLLVLDLHDPEGPGLWHGLTEQWPSFAAYAVSFVTIGIIWLNHNSLFGRLARLDRPIVTLNLLLLLVVSFIPFPTGMLASHLRAGGTDSRVAAAVYGATMTVMGAVFTTIWWQVSKREHLFAEDTTAHHVRAGLRRSLRGPIIYAAATAISVVSAYAALVGYAAVAAYFALPGRTLTATTDDDRTTGEDVHA
jgi:uncharacterized membrane protein